MYHFIVNVHGGSGKAFIKWNKIKKYLKKNNIPYKTHVPLRQGHAEDIAKNLSESEEKEVKIIIVGGDGSVNEVLNGISDFSKVRLGLIPTGSGNDFSRGLKIPRHNWKKALKKILDAKAPEKIDLGKVTSGEKSKIFGISSGFGLDAIVGTGINTSKIKKILNFIHLGKLSYAILTVKTLFEMKTQSVEVKFDDEPELKFNKLIFLAAMNSKAEGGGVPMSPRAKVDDGKLSACIVSGIPKWKTFLKFPLLCAGLHIYDKAFCLKDFSTLSIKSESPSILHTDGEFFGNITEAKFEVLPGKLMMLL